MLQKMLKISSVLAVGALLSFNANAAVDGNSDMLLDTLVQKGYLTHEEAASIGDTVTPMQALGAHTSKVSVNGLVHVGHYFVSTRRHNQTDGADQNDFRVTQARLGVLADLTPQWSAFMEVNFVGGREANESMTPKRDSVSDLLNRAYISWVAIEEELTFDFGYFYGPFGFEYNLDPCHLKTITYSPASYYFREVLMSGNYGYLPTRFVGFSAHGALFEDFYYNVALTSPQANKVNDLSGSAMNNTPALWGQLVWNTSWEEVSISLGINGAYLPEQPADRVGCGPCGGENPEIAGVPSDQLGKKFYFWGAFAELGYDRFALTAEVMGAVLEDQAGLKAGPRSDSNPVGLTIMPSFSLNDEIEFVLSYSLVDADDGIYFRNDKVVPGANYFGSGLTVDQKEKLSSVYLGANWYILGNDVKLSVGYQYTKTETPVAAGRENDGQLTKGETAMANQSEHDVIHAFRTRLQLVF